MRRLWMIGPATVILPLMAFFLQMKSDHHLLPASMVTRANETMADTDEIRLEVLKPAWPNPAILVGLPKAGTQSVADFFKCGCFNVSHYNDCHPERKRRVPASLCGLVAYDNILAGVDPLYNTGDWDVYAQLDVTFIEEVCFYPQIDALEQLHKYHPNSSFILNTRNATHWLQSVNHWRQNLRQRFTKCNLTDLPADVGKKDEEMVHFFHSQVKRIRDFVKRHPSHALVEIDIESNTTGAALEQHFGIPSYCWGHNDHRGGNKKTGQRGACRR